MEKIIAKIDANRCIKSFKHFYNAVGYANVDYTYTNPSKKMYEYLSSFDNHFKYMRMHNILTTHGKGDYYLINNDESYGHPPGAGKYLKGEDSVVSIDNNGELSFNWAAIDKVYDILQEHDIKPIVETVYMPHCLQKSDELWYIPKDYNIWKNILVEFVKHVQKRYGKEEVEQWYFEVWNEPDNHEEWVKNPQTFLALYDYMENAIHSVNTNLKVGGPATKQGDEAKKIFRAFLDHCTDGINYATGKFGTRVDFISIHCKGGWPDTYNPSMKVMFNSINTFIDILKEYPKFNGIEFFNDESDIVWAGNKGTWYASWLNFRNTHYFPGFVCKMVNNYCTRIEDEKGVNLSIVDSDNCHIQWEKYLFSGNRSQFTPLNKYPSSDIIKKPAFNAYVLLSRLGNKRLKVECKNDGFDDKFGVLPTIKDDILSIMVWNFEDGIEDDINHRQMQLNINNIPFKGEYKLVHYRIDKEHSSSFNAWDEMGRPDSPSIEQIKKIRQKEGLELYAPVKDITVAKDFSIKLDMPMHAVSLLLLVPNNNKVPEKISIIKVISEEGFNKNPQVFLKWEPSKANDFLYYRIWRKKLDEEQFTVISDNFSINTAVYTDMDVKKNSEYFYKIQPINCSMQEGEMSEQIKVKID